MKKFVQGAVLPFTLFASSLLILGCDSTAQNSAEKDINESQTVSVSNDDSASEQQTAKPEIELKSGNVFYIARDVADVQLKAGDYVEKVTQAQADLQNAIESKDQIALQETVKNLSQQLQAFNTALISLDLKTQEIDNIRQHVLKTNKELLNSALLNGNIDVSKINIKQFEQQVGTIQNEMLKLAGMLIPTGKSDSSQ